MSEHTEILHASCVALNGRGVLLLGASGSGKSDLALRMIAAGTVLVGDDQIAVTQQGETLLASPAPRLEGLLEARGVGLMRFAHVQNVPLALAVMLVAREQVERMPQAALYHCMGAQLPLLSLHAFDASTEAKIRFALAQQEMAA